MLEGRKVGIYMDVDNYTIPIEGRPDRFREGLQFIIRKAESEGEIVEARAYANYANQPLYLCRSLCAHGINMVFTPPLNGNGKNIDDQEMAKDIALTPYTRREINTIIVVSGDGHFVPAISSARGRGCKVIVICTSKPNAVLKEAADEVILINCSGQTAESSKVSGRIEGLAPLLTDIESLIKDSGTAFDRQSLIDALAQKQSESGDGVAIEATVNELINKNVITFSMANAGAGRSPALHINRSALGH